MLNFVIDDADVVEAPSQNQVHELDLLAVGEVQQFVVFYSEEDLVKDEFCFETLKMGFLDPFVQQFFTIFNFPHLLASLHMG